MAGAVRRRIVAWVVLALGCKGHAPATIRLQLGGNGSRPESAKSCANSDSLRDTITPQPHDVSGFYMPTDTVLVGGYDFAWIEISGSQASLRFIRPDTEERFINAACLESVVRADTLHFSCPGGPTGEVRIEGGLTDRHRRFLDDPCLEVNRTIVASAMVRFGGNRDSISRRLRFTYFEGE